MTDHLTTLDINAAIGHLRRVDPRLAALIDAHGPLSWRPERNAFRALLESIVSQQISGKAAEAILRRFRTLYPSGRFPTPAQVLATPVEWLRSAGLSPQKASYVQDLALKFTDGTIRPRRFSRLTDEAISTELIRVKGIGQWTADMFLIFCLNRPDVLSVGDLGIRMAMKTHYRLRSLPDPAKMRAIAEPWRPYRTVAMRYLWRSLDGAAE